MSLLYDNLYLSIMIIIVEIIGAIIGNYGNIFYLSHFLLLL